MTSTQEAKTEEAPDGASSADIDTAPEFGTASGGIASTQSSPELEPPTSQDGEVGGAQTTSTTNPVAPVNPLAAASCDVSFSKTSSELLTFVKLDEIVPCDLNQDGVIDLLAINHRLSTGYGFIGVGNGLFAEGPYLDLPFRPAAAAAAGSPLDNTVLLVSSEGTIALFHPLLTQDPPTQVRAPEIDIVRLGAACSPAPLAIVGGHGTSGKAEVYEITATSLRLLGEFATARAISLVEWFEGVRAWTATQDSIPIPPNGASQLVALADMNCDRVLDLVSCNVSGIVTLLLSDGTEVLSAERPVTQGGHEYIDLRLSDVDGNGLMDILLLDSSGRVDVLLSQSDG